MLLNHHKIVIPTGVRYWRTQWRACPENSPETRRGNHEPMLLWFPSWRQEEM